MGEPSLNVVKKRVKIAFELKSIIEDFSLKTHWTCSLLKINIEAGFGSRGKKENRDNKKRRKWNQL